MFSAAHVGSLNLQNRLSKSERWVKVSNCLLTWIPQKVLVHLDSRTVAMEVGTL